MDQIMQQWAQNGQKWANVDKSWQKCEKGCNCGQKWA